MRKGFMVLAVLGLLTTVGVSSSVQADFNPGPGPMGVIKVASFGTGPGPLAVQKLADFSPGPGPMGSVPQN